MGSSHLQSRRRLPPRRIGLAEYCHVQKLLHCSRSDIISVSLSSDCHWSRSRLSLYYQPNINDVIQMGVIDVVPNSTSRDEMGRAKINDLLAFFIAKFGNEDTVAFQRARLNFIQSMAAYSVACYILQIKDRHNGNIMIDGQGHIIHIDFGFLFDIDKCPVLSYLNCSPIPSPFITSRSELVFRVMCTPH